MAFEEAYHCKIFQNLSIGEIFTPSKESRTKDFFATGNIEPVFFVKKGNSIPCRSKKSRIAPRKPRLLIFKGTRSPFFRTITDRAHFWGRGVFEGADHDSGVRMARNRFRTAQYGKVRIRQKGEFYQSLSGPDATILIETQPLTVKSDLGLHFFLSAKSSFCAAS
ncbi:hypothetical protein L596_008945 [Steinernema carpocapsae]|uniref:Uncharacterized protein n=1 Tax=Steinernema carpocapsae TaxID=34508 RepID=A0A4U5PE97_STECR|nr:hypothetical protein L596_008945 [Steinernema carpocapsae]